MTNPTKQKSGPFLLMILDGWGYREDPTDNAIALAHTPNWDHLWENATHGLISGSGHCVGLPDGQMGNSEVGHLNMGAGRVVMQDFTRIEDSIADRSFFKNPAFLNAIALAKKNKSKIHVFGLLSPGGVHSHERHIHALCELMALEHFPNFYVHAFLDGRDTPPQSAEESLLTLDNLFKLLECGHLASITGRYYAMDRDKRWDRVERAYDLLTQGKTDYHATSGVEGLIAAYQRGENDEFVQPTAIHAAHQSPITIDDHDVVIFMNYRADRAREITRAFVEPHFEGFDRAKYPKLAEYVCLTEYAADIPATNAYPPQNLDNTLGEYLSKLGLKQLRIAETEKYAHVTFFFNGGVETAFPGEERILVPSPHVATYDLQPEMSAPELTEKLVAAITSQQFDVIICNYANADMVGHSGQLPATIRAIETLDTCIGHVLKAIKAVGGEMMITADHGNAEQMSDPTTHQPHTAHTSEPVPFIYVGRPAKFIAKDGILSDIAPTLLYLMGLKQPNEMTGHSLVKVERT